MVVCLKWQTFPGSRKILETLRTMLIRHFLSACFCKSKTSGIERRVELNLKYLIQENSPDLSDCRASDSAVTYLKRVSTR